MLRLVPTCSLRPCTRLRFRQAGRLQRHALPARSIARPSRFTSTQPGSRVPLAAPLQGLDSPAAVFMCPSTTDLQCLLLKGGAGPGADAVCVRPEPAARRGEAFPGAQAAAACGIGCQRCVRTCKRRTVTERVRRARVPGMHGVRVAWARSQLRQGIWQMRAGQFDLLFAHRCHRCPRRRRLLTMTWRCARVLVWLRLRAASRHDWPCFDDRGTRGAAAI